MAAVVWPTPGSNVGTWGNALGALQSYIDGISAVVNVKHPSYGATGNGSTDDTAAITAALAAAKAAGTTVYFPAGTYKITSNQTVDWDYATIIGDGANTVLAFVGSGLVIDGTATGYRFRTTLRDFRITRTGAAGAALLIKGAGGTTGAARFTIDNVDIKASTGDGMEIAGSFIGTITGSYFRECTGRGVYMHADLGTGVNYTNAIAFSGGEIQSNAGGGVEVSGLSRGIAFFGTCIENNTTFGARFNGGGAISLYGCYLESNGTIDVLVGDVTTVQSVKMEGCVVGAGVAPNTKSVNLVRGTGINIHENAFYGFGANPPISVNEASAGAVIGSAQNNTHDGAATTSVALNGSKQFSPLALVMQASANFDFPSIAAGNVQELTLTVPGCVQGDTATAHALTTAYPPIGVVLSATIGSANTVTIRAQNVTTAAIDPGNAPIIIVVHHWGG